jgi:hypothetical protein
MTVLSKFARPSDRRTGRVEIVRVPNDPEAIHHVLLTSALRIRDRVVIVYQIVDTIVKLLRCPGGDRAGDHLALLGARRTTLLDSNIHVASFLWFTQSPEIVAAYPDICSITLALYRFVDSINVVDYRYWGGAASPNPRVPGYRMSLPTDCMAEFDAEADTEIAACIARSNDASDIERMPADVRRVWAMLRMVLEAAALSTMQIMGLVNMLYKVGVARGFNDDLGEPPVAADEGTSTQGRDTPANGTPAQANDTPTPPRPPRKPAVTRKPKRGPSAPLDPRFYASSDTVVDVTVDVAPAAPASADTTNSKKTESSFRTKRTVRRRRARPTIGTLVAPAPNVERRCTFQWADGSDSDSEPVSAERLARTVWIPADDDSDVEPVTDEPVTDEPVTDEPVTDEPEDAPPTYEALFGPCTMHAGRGILPTPRRWIPA